LHPKTYVFDESRTRINLPRGGRVKSWSKSFSAEVPSTTDFYYVKRRYLCDVSLCEPSTSTEIVFTQTEFATRACDALLAHIFSSQVYSLSGFHIYGLCNTLLSMKQMSTRCNFSIDFRFAPTLFQNRTRLGARVTRVSPWKVRMSSSIVASIRFLSMMPIRNKLVV
jgi:hypothetical protein